MELLEYRSDTCELSMLASPLTLLERDEEVSPFFKELCVDMDKILEITQEILKLYEILKTYDEKKEMPGILGKAPKPKTSSRPSSSASTNSQYLSQSPVVSSQSGTPR